EQQSAGAAALALAHLAPRAIIIIVIVVIIARTSARRGPERTGTASHRRSRFDGNDIERLVFARCGPCVAARAKDLSAALAADLLAAQVIGDRTDLAATRAGARDRHEWDSPQPATGP